MKDGRFPLAKSIHSNDTDYCNSTWITTYARSRSLHSDTNNRKADNGTVHFLLIEREKKEVCGMRAIRMRFLKGYPFETNYQHCNSRHHGQVYTNNIHTLRYRIEDILCWLVLETDPAVVTVAMAVQDLPILKNHPSKNDYHLLWIWKKNNEKNYFIQMVNSLESINSNLFKFRCQNVCKFKSYVILCVTQRIAKMGEINACHWHS